MSTTEQTLGGDGGPGTDALRAQLSELAAAQGFARIGFARAEALDEDAARLRDWLAQGMHGTMAYMAQTADVRVDPRHAGMLPGALSVVVLAAPYARSDVARGLSPGRVARYAQGRDYHNVLYKRIRALTRALREAGYAARAAVDTMPVMERAWAQRAGVGFIGKNCCLIVPGLGSHVFLAAIVTDARFEPDAPMAQRCGDCTRCLVGCPTSAFAAARQLDARRCIAYLTIEHRGPIPEAMRPALGDWVFGCDACQDVCPFNRTAPAPAELTEPYAAHARFDEVDAVALLTMDEEAHRAFAQGSPLRRAGCEGLARNAALVLANTGERRALPVLKECASVHPSEVVRDAARWAIERLRE